MNSLSPTFATNKKLACKFSLFVSPTLMLVTLLFLSSNTQASVLVNGDVTPPQEFITDPSDGGIPIDGSIFPNNPLDPVVDWTFGSEDDIFVGQNVYGTMVINGESPLFYGNLVIGGSTLDNVDDPTNIDPTGGVGVVRITGFGSRYESFTGSEGGAAAFDLHVGYSGTGTLWVTNGGSAQITDAITIGLAPSGTGTIIVDGPDSALFNYGAGISDPGSENETSFMVVGGAGVGTLHVINGGTVQAAAGAVIGVDTSTGGTGIFPPPPGSGGPTGGRGTVLVDGTTSKWIIAAGGLMIGGADDDEIPDYTGSDAGQGTLTVSNGGLVRLTNGGNLNIGLLGRLTLETNGSLIVGDLGASNASYETNNDGVITGHGRIDTGTLLNKVAGEIRVTAGNKLLISIDTLSGDDSSLRNYGGLVEVIGGEIEFDGPASGTDRFHNEIGENLDGDPIPGLIHGSNANLRFRTGLLNEATMVFSAGDNIVSGEVENLGVLSIQGNETTVIFEDSFSGAGIIDLTSASAASVGILGDYDASDSLILMDIAGPVEGEDFSTINTTGIATFTDAFMLVDFVDGFAPALGDMFEVMTYGARVDDLTIINFGLPGLALAAVYNSDSLVLQTVLPTPGDFNTDGIVDAADYSVWRDTLGDTAIPPGSGADANGNGVIDAADYAIWKANFGSVASVPGSAAASGAAVPEPGTLMLLMVSLLALPGRRNRRS